MAHRTQSSDELRNRTRGAAAALAFGLALLVAGEALATNGTRLIGVGPRTVARGGVDVAIADDAMGIHTNPAGIAFIHGQRADLSAFLAMPDLTWTGATDHERSTGVLPGGAFGFVFDLDRPWLRPGRAELPSRYDPSYQGSGLKLGFGIFPVAGSDVDMRYTTPFWDADPDLGLPRESIPWSAQLTEIAVTGAAALRVNPRFSIGIAPSFIYSMFENVQPVAQPTGILQGHPANDQDTTYADFTPFLGVNQIEGFGRIEDASTYGFRGRIGATFHATDWLSLGLTYATQTFKQDYLGRVEIDFDRQIDKLGDDADLLRDAVEANTGIPADQQSYIGLANIRLSPMNQPQELSLGLVARGYLGNLPGMIGLDLHWLNWSATYRSLDGRITQNTSRELNELTGDGNTTSRISIPLNWRDQIVVGVGGALSVTPWLVLRAGYNYGSNPVPSDTLMPTTPAILEHHLTGGASIYYDLRRVSLELALSIEYALPNRVRMENHRGNESLNDQDVEMSALFVGVGLGISF